MHHLGTQNHSCRLHVPFTVQLSGVSLSLPLVEQMERAVICAAIANYIGSIRSLSVQPTTWVAKCAARRRCQARASARVHTLVTGHKPHDTEPQVSSTEEMPETPSV